MEATSELSGLGLCWGQAVHREAKVGCGRSLGGILPDSWCWPQSLIPGAAVISPGSTHMIIPKRFPKR